MKFDQKIIKTILIVLNIILLCVLVYQVRRLFISTGSKSEVQNAPAYETERIKPTEERLQYETEQIKSTDETNTDSTGEIESDMMAFREDLQKQINGYGAKVSVYVKDLKKGGSFRLDNYRAGETTEKIKAASLIKLFVMAAVYDQIENENLEETEGIDELLKKMITVSDNAATNELVRRLDPSGGLSWENGCRAVNEYIRRYDYSDTVMERDVRDYRTQPADGENYTSVEDCGELLEKIFFGTCVSSESSGKMYDLLKQQTRKSKIPQGAAGAKQTANKTGELDDTENDAAIIELEDTQSYILCVMTGEKTETSVNDIVSISESVYEYFKAK